MFIYILKDPDTGLVCYVGKTNNPRKRLNSHKNPDKRKNLHSVRWNRKLKEAGKFAVMEIIEETNGWEACEKKWISFYRNKNDAVNYFDDCIFNEFIKRKPGIFRILI